MSLSGGGTDTYSSRGTATGPGGMEVTSVTCTVTTAESLRDGAPQSVPAGTGWIDETGSDPVTGAAVDYHNDKYNPLNPPRIETGDWFSRLADFSAGAADALTGGLTRRVRQGLDLDGVNYNSAAYGVGTKVGTALDIALTPISPCGKARRLAQSIRGLSAVNATGQAVNAAEAIRNGDPLGFLANSVGALTGFAKLGRSCFTAGTPLLTPDGSRPIETLREGDLVLSRDENDPDGPVRPRRVVQTFVRVSPILNLHVAGQIIETTREHPFYVDGAGWRNACELRPGDRPVGHDGVRATVEGVADSGRVGTVYNVEVEEDHTYFVGGAEWCFSVWAHNLNYRIAEDGSGKAYVYLEKIATPIQFANRAAAIKWANNAGHTAYSVPLSPPKPFPGAVMMPISKLQPSPAALAQQPAVLATKLMGQGFFNWKTYLPILAWVKNGVWYYDNGMTRIANAQMWNITHLPVKRVSPP